MNQIRMALVLLVAASTAGCSKTHLWCSGRGGIDKLAALEDRTLAWRTFAALRAANLVPVKGAFDPEVYARSLPMMSAAAAAMPRFATPGTPYLARFGSGRTTEGGTEKVYRELDYQLGCGENRVVVRTRIADVDGRRQVVDWHVDQFVAGRVRTSVSPRELVTTT